MRSTPGIEFEDARDRQGYIDSNDQKPFVADVLLAAGVVSLGVGGYLLLSGGGEPSMALGVCPT